MKVLLVDDQERILLATKKLVNWEKLHIDEVYTAISARNAKKIMEQHKIDIMLTDIEMPEEDGISLQQWQVKHYPMTYCIFLTSHADFSYAKEAIRSGAFDYILQPASIPEIEAALERCIQKLQVREETINKCQEYDELTERYDLAPYSKPDTEKWSQWMLRGDQQLVRNQIMNLLRLAEQEGFLSIGYRQNLIHSFLESCSVVVYEKNMKLEDLFSDSYSYEDFRHAYRTNEELMQGVDQCFYGYRMLLLKQDSNAEAATTIQERIQDVVRYLDGHMDQTISRREAAKYVFLNEDYFTRMFRKEMGMGYKEYCLKIKMEYAAKLLESTTLPIVLISSKVGYDNYAHFTQMFRRLTGETPSDYRKNHGSRKSDG